MPGPSFDVRVLGRFAVLRDGDEVPPASFAGRLPRRLVRVLIARRGEHVPKDVLAEALWPIRAPSDPGSNLEVLVSRARRALGDPSLVLTGPRGYAFSTEDRCRVDAEELLRSVEGGLARSRAGDPAAALAEFDRAVSLWGGEPFAEDLYEDWAEPFRARLRDALQVALEEGAAAALETGDPRRAVALATQAATREPLRESAAILRVRALVAGGDRAGALEAYERFRVGLAEELGLDPSEEAAAMLAKVLRGETLAPVTVAPELTLPFATELPFAGREAELRAALGASERVVLVTGPSGSGKSRFLDELARRAHVPVLRAAAVPPERDEPWTLARSLLREALALDALAARSLPGLSVAALRDVLPELAEPSEEHRAPLDRESRRALATEGARLLLEAAAGPGALVLVDDLQWADGTSLHVLAVAAARVPALRLVFAVRSDETAASSPAAAFLSDLRQAGKATVIELGPLPADALERVTGDAGVAAAIAAETVAIPLVVVEAVRLLEERGLIGADATGRRRPTRPITLDEARDAARSAERRRAAARLARLDRQELDVLEALAAVGRETPAETLAAVVGRGPADILASLDTLVRAGFVRLAERGWVPAHDSISQMVEAELEPGRRMRLQGSLARALEAEGAEPSEVAAHLMAAGDVAGALERYLEAAELSLARFANEESRSLADAALELGPPATTRVRLLAIRAESLARMGELDGAKRDLRDALAAAPPEPDRAGLLTRLAVLESGSEDYETAGALVELALSAAGEDPRRRAEAHAVGAIVDLNLGDLERSELRSKTALELFEANGDARGAAGILDGRAMATFFGGRIREAVDAFERAARLFRDAGELLRVGTPRSTRGHALVFLARAGEGLADIEDALALSRTLGHAEGESYALWHRAEALGALGRGEEAVASASRALAIAERIRHREWTAASLRGLGIALESTGEVERAIEVHRRGLAASEGMPLFTTWAAARLASCLVQVGRLDEAEAALGRARADLAPLSVFEARLAEAELLAARGDGDVLEFAEAAARIAEDAGHVVSAIRLRALSEGQRSA
jgi:DNA-binding SARP family transcriptional activator